MTEALAIQHLLEEEETVELTVIPTEKPVKSGITVEKQILRVKVVDTGNSINLDENATYYAEPHGKAHFYISNYPSGKLSHMGVYQRERFKVISEETIAYEPPLHVLKLLRREGQLNDAQLQQLAAFEAGEVVKSQSVENVPSSETVSSNTPVQCLEVVNSSNAVQAEEERVNDDLTEKEQAFLNTVLLPSDEREVIQRKKEHNLLRPNDEDYPHGLLHDQVYSAVLTWCKYGYRVENFVGQQLYIKRICEDNPYYEAHVCSVYTDKACENLLVPRLPLAWFTDFQLIDVEADSIEVANMPVVVTKPIHVEPVAVEEEQAEEVTPVVETATVKEEEQSEMELEQLTLF